MEGQACFLNAWEPRVWRGKEELLPLATAPCQSAGVQAVSLPSWQHSSVCKKQVRGSWRDGTIDEVLASGNSGVV